MVAAVGSKSLLWKLLLPVPIVAIATMALAWAFIPAMVVEGATAQATEAALQTANQFKKIRAYYTSNVVAKVLGKSDIKASHDHAKEPGSIPLPATMIHDLSKLLEQEKTTISLFSVYPFPNRKDRTLDEFQSQAWTYLVANPDKVFTRDGTREGKRIVRVAVADTMTAQGCVGCHNSYPTSPKTGWKLGDVRGVLEISILVDDQYAAARALATKIVLAIIVAGIVLIMLTSFIGRRITLTIRRMAEAMRRLTSNDLKAEVPCLERRDEIGEIAKALIVFRDGAVEKLRVEQEAAEQRRTGENERTAREAEKAEEARQAQATIAALGAGLQRLADGDLFNQIETPFAPNAEKLRADFNAAVAKLRQTMQSVVTSTQAIHSGTLDISSASGDLSRRTEQQASSLEETAAALDEITATVRKAAEGATHARQVVAETKTDAGKVGEVVRKAVEAMGGIEKSSQQISQIIGVIDEIAFQTNLLALNAGVEAARAGDAGRGFAVVASEVRALAQRSAEAAKEIKALISTSTAQVGQGVQLVAETGNSLERIMAKVVEINNVVTDIASGAQEQATGLQQVNTAVNEMDKVTQQNAAMAEEATAQGHSLAQEAEQLSGLVGQFRLGNVAHLGAARRAAPQAEAHSPRQQLKAPAGRNGAAVRKPDPAPAEPGWEDF